MSYESCKRIILERHPDSNVVSSFALPNSYIFSLKPKTWKEDDYVLDSLFKVSLDGKITEYSVLMDPEEFGQALKNRIE